MRLFQSETIVVDRDTDGALVLLLDVPGRSVNVITRQVLADLESALDALTAQSRIPVLVIRSGKKSGFLAGADLSEFLALRDATAARGVSQAGQTLFNKLANFPSPTVAIVHGPCLGGGLELALACDYRLVFDRQGTQLGLPEVELGLLPGWGGTQRLPRVVGLEKALQMILTGKRLDAREAFKWGLSDACPSTETELREQYAALVVRAIGKGKVDRRKLPLRTWRQKLLESNAFGRRMIIKGTERLIRHRVPDDMPAPTEALEAVRIGLRDGIEVGLTAEREAAGRLALSPACRNLIHLFFQREAARKMPAGLEQMPAIQKIGIVGAGIMGGGIAQLAALQGREVVVQEVNAQALGAGMGRIDDLFAKAVARRRFTEQEARQKRQLIRGTIAWEGFDKVQVVIEAAVEDLELKRNLFRELENRTPETAILATNTSSLPVARVQEGMKHPERIAAMHFFNPVHKMPLVELARTRVTNEGTVAQLQKLAIDLGKTPVVIGDGPGFVVNRILMPYLNEAILLVGEGVPIVEMDRVMKRFGMPMGPLELLDQIGLDVAAHVAVLVHRELGERFAPNPVFGVMKERGLLGQKCGQGFYLHKGKSPKPNKAAQELVKGQGKQSQSDLPVEARLAEARERLVLLMVNEAAMLAGEGIATAESIDLAMVFGTGWAPHRGGPLKYADTRGIGDIVQALTALKARLGPRFEPGAELKNRVGSTFRG